MKKRKGTIPYPSQVKLDPGLHAKLWAAMKVIIARNLFMQISFHVNFFDDSPYAPTQKDYFTDYHLNSLNKACNSYILQKLSSLSSEPWIWL